MSRKACLVAVMACVGLLGLASAQGQTDISWDGSMDSNWFLDQNWSPVGVPGVDANAIFADQDNRTVDLQGQDGTALWVNLMFGANNYTIQNGGLLLSGGGGIISRAGTGAGNTISASVSGTNLNINVDSGLLELSGNNAGMDAGSVATIDATGELYLTHYNAAGSARIDMGGGTLRLAEVMVSVIPDIQSLDVGDDVSPGTGWSYEPGTDQHTLIGNGHDIWDDADDFRYAYLPLSGDIDAVAHVGAMTGPGDNGWRKAGIMVRETTDAGSRHATMVLTPDVAHGASLQSRSATDGGSANIDSNMAPTPPGWIRLVRSGDTFTGYWSTDGEDWTEQGAVSIAMPTDVLIGLAVTSHEEEGKLTTVAFDNVSFFQPTPTGDFGNNVVALTATSSIIENEGPIAALLGTLDMQPDSTLTAYGDVEFGAMTMAPGASLDANDKFSATSLGLDGGTATVTLRNGTYTVGPVNDGGTPTVLLKDGIGTLDLNTLAGTALAADSDVHIAAGKVRATKDATASTIGDARVVLAGGTLEVEGYGLTPVNGFAASRFAGNKDLSIVEIEGTYSDPRDTTTFTGSGGLLAESPGERTEYDGPLIFGNWDVGNGVGWNVPFPTNGGGDNFQTLFTGQFNTGDNGGTWTFRARIDDDGGFWIDLDHNGVFELSDRIVVSHWNDGGNTNTVDLEPDTTYNVAFTTREGGGGDQAYFVYMRPGETAESWIDSSNATQDGWWTHYIAAGYPDYGNDVLALAGTSSAIEVVADGAADFGQLTVGDGAAVALKGSVTFTNTVIQGSTATLSTLVGVSSLGKIEKQSGDLTITAAGTDGTLALTNTYFGSNLDSDTTLLIQGGTVSGRIEGGRSSLGEAAIELDGGTLDLGAVATEIDPTFQYYRFTPTLLRGRGTENSVQLSEMQVLLDTLQVTGATATNPGGNNPAGEPPSNAVDGDTGTKWLDLNKGAIVLDFGAATTIDQYQWATANDTPDRDPIRWKLEGSNDNATWEMLSDLTREDQTVTTDRYTFVGPFDAQQVLLALAEYTNPVTVVGPGSGIAVGGPTRLGLVTMNDESGVTITGSDSLTIPSLKLVAREKASVVTMDVAGGIDVIVEKLTEADDANNDFTKLGEGRLIFPLGEESNDDKTYIVVQGGDVLVLADSPNPGDYRKALPDATFELDGGTLGIVSADGNDLVWDNDTYLNGSGTIYAGSGDGIGHAGPVQVTLALPYDLEAPDSSTLTFEADAGYTLAVENEVYGDGNGVVVKDGEGTVVLNVGLVHSGSTTVKAGTLRTNVPIEFTSEITVDGGLLDANGIVDLVTFGNDPGNATVNGGGIHARETFDANALTIHGGDSTFEGNVTLIEGLTITNGRMVTGAMATLDTPALSATGGELQADGIVLAPSVEVNGATVTTNDQLEATDILVQSGALNANGTVSADVLNVTGGLYNQPTTDLNVPEINLTGGVANVGQNLSTDSLTLTTGAKLDIEGTVTATAIEVNDGLLFLNNAAALDNVPDFTLETTSGGSWLNLGTALGAGRPIITVASGSLMDGNTLGSVFSGACCYDSVTMPLVNVVLEEGAIWGGTTAPTTDMLGGIGPADANGDRLGRAIIGDDDAEKIKLGDDPLEIDDIYRTASYGPWTVGPFVGEMVEGTTGQGLDINVNGVTDVEIGMMAKFTTANEDTGVHFVGPGTVTFTASPWPMDWNVISRTGPEDLSQVNQDILVLDAGAVYDDKEFKVANGRVRLTSNEALKPKGTLTLQDGSFVDLDNIRPTQGTFNVEEGAMVWVNDNNRFNGGADFTWEGGSMLVYRCDQFDPTTVDWPTNVHFINDHANYDRFDGAGLVLSDGAYLIGPVNHFGRISGDNTGVRAAPDSLPGDTIGVAKNRTSDNWDQKRYYVEDPFDLSFEHDGNQYALNLLVGSDHPMTTVMGNNNKDRWTGWMEGTVLFRERNVVGDVTVLSGQMRIDLDRGARTWESGGITIPDANAERRPVLWIRRDQSDASNRGTVTIKGDIDIGRDGFFSTHQDAWDTTRQIVDGNFVDNITVRDGGAAYFWLSTTGNGQYSNQEIRPGVSGVHIEQLVTVTGGPAGTERYYNWIDNVGRMNDNHAGLSLSVFRQGGGNAYLKNLVLRQDDPNVPAVLSMRPDGLTLYADLTFETDATTSDRSNSTSGPWHVINALSTGGDRVWTIGEDGQDYMRNELWGNLGDESGRFTVNIVNGELWLRDLDQDPNYPRVFVNEFNLMGNNSTLRPYARNQLRGSPEEGDPGPYWTFDWPINVIDADGDPNNTDGTIHTYAYDNPAAPWAVAYYPNVHLAEGATMSAAEWAARPIFDLHLDGDATYALQGNSVAFNIALIDGGPGTIEFRGTGDGGMNIFGPVRDHDIIWDSPSWLRLGDPDNNGTGEIPGIVGNVPFVGDSATGFDGGGNRLFVTHTGGNVLLVIDPNLSLIDHMGTADDALILQYTRAAGDYNPDMQINLRGGRFQIQTERASGGNWVNYLGEVRVIADTAGSLRTNFEGSGSGDGFIRLSDLVMEPSSSFEVVEWDDVPAYINATLEGDATFYYAEDLGDGGGESFRIESATGAHTLTITGGRETGDAGWNTFWVTGPITTAGVVFEPNSAGRESLRTWFQSGSSLDVGSVHFQANAIVEFRDGSSLTADALILDSNQVDIATTVPVVVGTATVNTPVDFRPYDITVDHGIINTTVAVGGDVKGARNWTVNGPDGVLDVFGLTAASGGAYTIDDATMNLHVDGDAAPGADVNVIDIANLNVDRETEAGETDKTLTFGNLALSEDESVPKLILDVGHDYNVSFTGTSLSAATKLEATLEVLSENTTVDLGPVTFSAAEETFNIDANHGSLVKLGPLTGTGYSKIVFGGGAVTGGGIQLSNSTAWSGEVSIDSGWLRLDAELTGYPVIDVYGGIDVAVNNFNMTGWQAVHLRLSESMVGVTAPGGYRIAGDLLPGQLVLNAPAIDAGLVRGDGAGGTQDMLLVWDEYDEYEWEAAVYSDHDGARYEAVLNLAGLVQLGDVNGRGKDFEIAGVIGDDLSAYATTDPNIVDWYNEMGSLEKVGSETVTLSGSNTYNGNTLVRDGTLVMGHVRAFGDNANTVELLGGTLRVAAAGASFDPGTVGYNLLVTDSNSVLELAANSVDLGPAVIGDATLVLSSDQAGSTAPTAAITGTLVLNTPEVHEDFVVGLSGTVQSDGNTLVHSVLDKEHTTFAIGVGQKLTIDDDVAAGSLREWSIEGGTVEVLGNVTSPDSLRKTGTGTLVLDGDNSGLTQLEIGDAVTGTGDIVIANHPLSAPADVLINSGSMYTVLPANHDYDEVNSLSEGVVALSAGVDAATTVDFSGSMGLSLGARENVVFAGNLIPGTDGAERHYYFGGGGAEIRIEDVLEDYDGATSVDFGWDVYNDPIPMGTAVVAADNTLTGDVNIYMPVIYGAGRKPFEGVDPLSGRFIRVFPGGVLDLNSTAARQDNILSEGGSVINTAGELSAALIQTIWPDGDYIIGGAAAGTTTYADGGFVRLDANVIKIGTDTSILGTPDVAGASFNTYGGDMDGFGTPGETVVQAGTLILPEGSVLGGSKTLDIQAGATVDVPNGAAWDGVVRLAGTLNVPGGQALTLSDPGGGVDLAGSPAAPGQFTGGGLIDLGGNIITGGQGLEVLDGGTVRYTIDSNSGQNSLVLLPGATAKVNWAGSVDKPLGVMYPGSTIEFESATGANDRATHNTGKLVQLLVDEAAWLAAPDMPQYNFVVDGEGNYFGTMMGWDVHPDLGINTNTGLLNTPTATDGNGLVYHPVAIIEKTGSGMLGIGGSLFGQPDDINDPDEAMQVAGKAYWVVKEGDLGVIQLHASLGGTAGTWVISSGWSNGPHDPTIAYKNLEGIELHSGTSLTWAGTHGFLPDSVWRTPEYAHEDGNGWNPGEFIMEDGSALYAGWITGRDAQRGMTGNYDHLTLGLQEFDPDDANVVLATYLAYPTIRHTGMDVPTVTFGGPGTLRLHSGVDADTLNASGSTYNAIVDGGGRVEFSSDLPGAIGPDNILTLTARHGTAAIYNNHSVITATTTHRLGTLQFDSNSNFTGSVFNDGTVRVSSGANVDLGTTVIDSSLPGTDYNILVGGFAGEYWQDSNVANLPELVLDTDFDALGDPNFTRTDATIDFMNDASFNLSATDPNWVSEDYFSVRWKADLAVSAEEAGVFEFWCDSDDGSVLWIDDEIVIDNDGVHGSRTYYGTVDLAEGPHTLTFGMHEIAGGARARLGWNLLGVGDVIFDGTGMNVSGVIDVAAGGSLALGGFTNAYEVNVDGAMTMGVAMNNTSANLRVGEGGVLNLGDAGIVVENGTINGTLRATGTGVPTQFENLTIGGTSAVIDLGTDRQVEATNATVGGGFTFGPTSVATFNTMTANGDMTIGPDASVTATEAIAGPGGRLILGGGDTDFDTITTAGGTLEFASNAGFPSDQPIVNNGIVEVKASAGTVNLQGAVIETTDPDPIYANGIRGSMFQPVARNEGPLNLDDATYILSETRVLQGDKPGTILTMAEMPGRNVVLMGDTVGFGEFPGGSAGEDFVTAVSGRMFPDANGVYNFHWNNDDRGLMYIDLDDDGMFENSERVAGYAWNSNGNVTLTAGQGYTFMYMAQEYGGGDNLDLRFTPPGGGEVPLNATAQPGLWKYVLVPYGGLVNIEAGATLQVGGLTNAVEVNAGGTLELYTGTSTAAQVNIPEGGTVNIRSASLDVGVGTVEGSLLGDGTGLAKFGELTIQGAAPEINLSGGPLQATNATVATEFAFDGGSTATFTTLATAETGNLIIESGANVTADQVTIEKGQSLTLRGGSLNTPQIENRQLVRVESGVNDLSGTMITTSREEVQLPIFNEDVSSAQGGSYTQDGGLFTIEGAGGDIWGSNDRFHYVYTPMLDDDGEFIAEVLDVEQTNEWAKAGIMIREKIGGVFTQDSRHAFMAITPGAPAGTTPDGRRSFQGRQTIGSGTCFNEGQQDGGGTQRYIKLIKSGNAFSGWQSTDGGVTWVQVGNTMTYDASFAAADLYVGLAVTSHTDDTDLCTAVIDNVSLFSWLPNRGDLVVDAGTTLKIKGFSGLDTVAVEGTLQLGDAESGCAELAIGDAGLLNIGISSVLIETTPLAQVVADIKDGGIASSCAEPEGFGIAAVAGTDGVTITAAVLGDTDLDGVVDRDDFLTLRSNFDGPGGWEDGDATLDTQVNYLDYIWIKKNIGQSFECTPTGVPEPATLGLLAIGAAGVLLRRRRRK